MSQTQTNKFLLQVKGLKVYFPIRRGVLKRVVGWVHAVEDVSFTIRQGETLGLVGESGCGKTTILRTIVRCIEPTGGEVLYAKNGSFVDIAKLEKEELRDMRKEIRMVFQDPESSLNPRMTLRDIIAEPLLINKMVKSRKALNKAVGDLMVKVDLNPEYLERYPYAFSGGQRQRIGIARALGLNPGLLLADEPTSALDVSVQAQILNLLMKLQKDMNLSILFVTHDLSVVRHVSDRIAVMYLGQIVEIAKTKEIFTRPYHPYTEALFSAIPQPNPHKRLDRIMLKGDIPDVAVRPPGCSFHPRCQYAQSICKESQPQLVALGKNNHKVACHFAKDLKLKGEAELQGNRQIPH